jgi:hypothetical protein
MAKENVEYIQNWILVSHKNKLNADNLVTWVELESFILSEISEAQKDK